MNNLSKTFAEIISIDAWRAAFDENGKATVHVDLSFRPGLIGAEQDYEVTFTLSLRRALLKVVIPATENIAVVQSSVDREPTLEGVRRVIKESQVGRSGAAGISAQLKHQPALAANIDVKANKSSGTATSTEFTTKISEFQIQQIVDAAHNYGWEITPVNGGGLSGKVWDPVKRPRLTVKKVSESKIDPGFQVHVCCRKGDLLIDEVKLKSGKPFLDHLKANRIAAAKAVIRSKLINYGFDFDDNSNDLVEVSIAEIAVVEEVN